MRIEVRTSARSEFVDVTAMVADVVAASGVSEGVAVVYCPHTTASVAVNEHADPDVARDLQSWLSTAVPRSAEWRHTVEGNADAHVKATLVGSSVMVPVSQGRLALGTWQGVFFCEFDGPRSRNLEVRVLG
jgi:secondary thiamine-phosphate synthase enzyme